jgi:hypothetical protein
MLADAHDFEKLISIWIHADGPLTDADVARLVAIMRQTGAVLARKSEAVATTLVVVESSHFPDAKQRQQLGVTSRALTRSHVAVVNRSMLIRGVLTAIRWLNSNKEYFPHLFATYDEARSWMVERTGYSSTTFDALYAQARSKMSIMAAPNAAHP